MEKNNKFIKNTLIIFIGKFSTQFMSLLLIPLFTHCLSTIDYGMVDLIQTYIALFIPVLTLRIDSALFRFLVEKRNDNQEQKSIITNTIFIMVIGVLFTIVSCYIVFKFVKIDYALNVIINLIVLMISCILLQVLRGLGKNKEYSIACIITGVSNLVINILLIVEFKYGAESILIASSVSNMFCILYTILKSKIWNKVEYKKISKHKMKELLSFSVPMIPDYLSGWIVNVSDRTILSLVLGSEYNGIYTISSKFSNILNSLFSIYNMSWQETAILHINDEDRDEFFSEVFNKTINLFSGIGIVMLTFLPLVYNIIIGKGFAVSYIYIPILIYANTWRVLVGLTMGIYIAKKKTKEVALTTFVAAIINIILNLLLIKFLGVYAACISTLLAYFVMAIYRFKDCKKYVNIKLNVKSIVLFSLIFGISSILYYINNYYLNVINFIGIIIYFLLTNKIYINEIVKVILNKINKRK